MVGPETALKLNGAPIAILDFESTGVDPRVDHPVQVSILHATIPSPEARVVYTTRIRPPIPVPEGASAVHGLRDEDLVDAPTMSEALPSILEALEGRLLVAYNLPYDLAMLRACCLREGAEPVPVFGLDPYVWARTVDKFQKGKKLVDVCGRRGIEIPDAHDSTADCVAVAALLPKLLGEYLRHIRGSMSPEQWRASDLLGSVSAFYRRQVSDGYAAELDFARYMRRQGKPIDSLSWHELTGQTPPAGLLAPAQRRIAPPPDPNRCPDCGLPVVVGRSLSGGAISLDAEPIEVLVTEDRQPPIKGLKSEAVQIVGTDHGGWTSGFRIDDALLEALAAGGARESDRRYQGRTGHRWTCAKARAKLESYGDPWTVHEVNNG